MNALQKVFDYQGAQVRTSVIDGQYWFVAKDVCDILLYANSRTAIDDNVDIEDVATSYIPHPQSDTKEMMVTCVNESGLYSLILRSNMPKAREFKRWVTHEILPSIRQTGSYNLPRNEYIKKTMELYRSLGIDINRLGNAAQNTFLKMMDQAGKAAIKESTKKEKEAAIITSAPEPGNMLQELLSHAVPIYGYKPKNDKEVKASVLKDGDNYYIFPEAVHYYLREYRAKKSDIYKEIGFLGGSGINKRFEFFGKKSRTYRVHVLPISSNVVRLPG